MIKHLLNIILLILFSSKGFSQYNEQLEIGKALSYYYGMEYSLDCIIKNYSDLKGEAMINKMNLTIAHKSSVDSMKKVLYTLSKEKYQVLESLTKQIINCDLISNELSKDYLKNFTNDKVKGNHDIYNEFVQILLKYNPKYLNNNTKEFMDDFRTKYSTKNHPKSKGLNYTISFPKSWIVKEGERPNIIINAHDQRNQNISLVLMTKEFMTKSEFDAIVQKEGINPRSEIFKDNLKDLIFNTDFIDNLTEGTIEKRNAIKTKLDGQPAILLFSRIPNERLGIKMEIYSNIALVLYNNYLITITLGVVNFEKDPSFDYTKIESGNIDILFKSILNTLVINNKWE